MAYFMAPCEQHKVPWAVQCYRPGAGSTGQAAWLAKPPFVV